MCFNIVENVAWNVRELINFRDTTLKIQHKLLNKINLEPHTQPALVP